MESAAGRSQGQTLASLENELLVAQRLAGTRLCCNKLWCFLLMEMEMEMRFTERLSDLAVTLTPITSENRTSLSHWLIPLHANL